MKRGIKDRHHWQVGQATPAGADTLQVRRIMQRGKLGELLNGRYDLIIYQHRLGEALSTMHDSVADGGDFAQVADDTMLGVSEGGKNIADGHLVVRHFTFHHHGLPPCHVMAQACLPSPADDYALGDAVGE